MESTLAFLAAYAEDHDWPAVESITTSHIEEYFVYFQDRPLWFGERSSGKPRQVGAVIDMTDTTPFPTCLTPP